MIEEFLRSQLQKTGWHFVSLVSLMNHLKGLKTDEEIRAELNRLFPENKIVKRAGINSDLIEITDKNL